MPPPLERKFVGAVIPSAGGRVIVSPFQFLTDGSDHLRLQGWNSVTGVSIRITWRFADLDGTIKPFDRTLALSADRTRSRADIPLGVGYLVNLMVVSFGNTTRIGQTFVTVQLIRGFSGATVTLGLLVQGYVTIEQGLGWPGSPIQSSLDTDGVSYSIVGTDPAAGVEISETVPTGVVWDLLTLHTTFTTGPTVGGRFPRLRYVQVGQVSFISPSTFNPAENETHGMTWAQAMPHVTTLASAELLAGLTQPTRLMAGDQWQTITQGLTAGDNWSAPVYTVREWLNVDA